MIGEYYKRRLKDCTVEILNGVGHWHVTEDVDGVALIVKCFMTSGRVEN